MATQYFSYSYDNHENRTISIIIISIHSQVCQSFNKCCEQLLNSGFSKIDKLHAQIQKQVKSQLPRRESERRNHPLARHADILSAIETRLSLLGMTYMRYIDMGLCCFIPGKVILMCISILFLKDFCNLNWNYVCIIFIYNFYLTWANYMSEHFCSHFICLTVCQSVCKLLTFLSSSQTTAIWTISTKLGTIHP